MRRENPGVMRIYEIMERERRNERVCGRGRTLIRCVGEEFAVVYFCRRSPVQESETKLLVDLAPV